MKILLNLKYFEMKKLFLISSSRYQGGEIWAHCLNSLGIFLGPPEPGRNKILFVPYAKADEDYDGYTKSMSEPFDKLGYELVSVHTFGDDPAALYFYNESFVGVCVGEGNTWLLRERTPGVVDARILEKVESGELKYISASAGTVMACPSMLTTNDMAPVLPSSDCGFGLVPFQINPHFVPGVLVEKHMGETREERICQVILANPEWQVVGLPEGCWIEGEGEKYVLRGVEGGQAAIFRNNGNNSIWLLNEPYNSTGML